MKFSESVDAPSNRIRGYDQQHIYVNSLTISAPTIISSDNILTWKCRTASEIDELSLAPALSLEPGLVLIGSGRNRQLLPAQLVANFGAKGIGLEVMDTPAACRTWNLLVDEGRRVVAALLLPNQA